jgi:ATP synthase F1 gamma subunit
MIPLPKLKKEVQFNQELTYMVDVLRGIAISRYYVLEKQWVPFEEFSEVCTDILGSLDLDGLHHPFVQPASSVHAVLMVTSDAGFLGGLNAQVVTVAVEEAGPEGLLTVVGERGASYLADMGRTFTPFPGIQDASRHALAEAVKDHLIHEFLARGCGRLSVVYPKPISFAVQQVVVEPFLPITAWSRPLATERSPGSVLWESQPKDVLEYVISQWMTHRLSVLFALSRLAELAARALHLEGSYQELQRQGKRLRLQYFRTRHELIDRSIREIFATQLLYKRKEDSAEESLCRCETETIEKA